MIGPRVAGETRIVMDGHRIGVATDAPALLLGRGGHLSRRGESGVTPVVQRRSNAASTRTKPPIADVILGPCAQLSLAPDMADEIAMRWAVLGPVGHQRFAAGHADHASMLADTQRLANQVRERAARKDFCACLLRDMARTDDGADNFADEYVADLVKLVRHDPRYLASDLVVGTVLLWKLQIIRGMQHARRGAKRKDVATRARKYLGDLAVAARALAVVTGRGRQEFIDPIVLLADHEHHVDMVRDVIKMIESGKRNDEIASAAKLSPMCVAAIRRRPRAVKQHAEHLTLKLYDLGVTADRLGRLLRDARDALDPPPPGWPRPRRARRGKPLVPLVPIGP